MKTALKIGIIAFTFAGTLMILLFLKGESLSGNKLHKMVFIDTAEGWQGCELKSCRFDDNSIVLLNSSEPAEVTTQSIAPGFPFDEVILSWNASEPDSLSALEFEVGVSADKETWYPFHYQTWGPLIESKWSSSGRPEYKGIGKVNTDCLNLEKPMRYVKVRVRALGELGARDIELRRLALSFASKNSTWDDYQKYRWKGIANYEYVKLAVPYFSQRNLPEDISGSTCSPTSVGMVLNYYSKDINPEQFAHLVYDPRGKIFGNWPHNMAAAYTCGMGKTWVESHSSFDEIYSDVQNGIPVIISIAYSLGELPHSPIHEAPEGHLICVIGFNGPDTVICNDPAGHNIEDGIISYPRHELEKVWIGHGGIAYHLWPN